MRQANVARNTISPWWHPCDSCNKAVAWEVSIISIKIYGIILVSLLSARAWMCSFAMSYLQAAPYLKTKKKLKWMLKPILSEKDYFDEQLRVQKRYQKNVDESIEKMRTLLLKKNPKKLEVKHARNCIEWDLKDLIAHEEQFLDYIERMIKK